MPYSQLLRRARVFQALQMMQKTSFDNTEIALELNYTDLTNMARDFRTVLDCSPSKARENLLKQSLLEILS